GTRVTSFAAARTHLSFVPVAPRWFARPRRMFVHRLTTPKRRQALGLIYVNQTYGRFVVVECLRKSTVADREPECLNPWGGEFAASFTPIRLVSRPIALLTSNAAENIVSWSHAGIGFD